MKPFVNRMRLRLKALELTDPDAAARLDQAQEDMWSILKKKKISRIIANQIIAETLDTIGARHRIRPRAGKRLSPENASAPTLLRRKPA